MNQIIAGFGFRSTANMDSLIDAYQKAGGSDTKITAITTAQDKSKATAFQNIAIYLNLPKTAIVVVEESILKRQKTPTQSAYALRERGLGSLAEAAALAAAEMMGKKAQLLGPRAISNDKQATCALALLEEGWA